MLSAFMSEATLVVYMNYSNSLSVSNVTRVLSEGAAVQRREPAGQWDALLRAQAQECTENHAESRVPLSRYV